MEKLELENLLAQVKGRAAKLHEDVNQHYDEHPYSYHLNMVADFAKKGIEYLGIRDEYTILAIMFGAYFHDSIEDARQTYNDVHKIANEYMPASYAKMAVEIVYALTNEKGRNRSERANDAYYEGIRDTPFASLVKVSDRLANMSYSKNTASKMYDVYKSEADHFIKSVVNREKINSTLFSVPYEMQEQLKGL